MPRMMKKWKQRGYFKGDRESALVDKTHMSPVRHECNSALEAQH